MLLHDGGPRLHHGLQANRHTDIGEDSKHRLGALVKAVARVYKEAEDLVVVELK